ncbi:uncharacterized protein LOC142586868 isoform X1 [Dermacentor variabilis]|uniref:uncharacterized protein LOC142586868 isoform X1 n=1 Tax=Dermacentor variabilis TaxID=34621 RepID=UPI003F5B2B3F
MPFQLPALLVLVIGSFGCGSENLTEDVFMQAMVRQQPYWMLQRSYNDSVNDGKSKVCIQTTQATSNEASAGTTATTYTFLRKYKLKGCDWFFTTHDAKYSVKFSQDAEAGAYLSMTMDPITAGMGDSANYKFQYWNTTENCFVLTLKVNENEKRCELNAWDSVATEDANVPACKAAYEQQCPSPAQTHEVLLRIVVLRRKILPQCVLQMKMCRIANQNYQQA